MVLWSFRGVRCVGGWLLGSETKGRPSQIPPLVSQPTRFIPMYADVSAMVMLFELYS